MNSSDRACIKVYTRAALAGVLRCSSRTSLPSDSARGASEDGRRGSSLVEVVEHLMG